MALDLNPHHHSPRSRNKVSLIAKGPQPGPQHTWEREGAFGQEGIMQTSAISDSPIIH
jgi:hypothetical protein